MGEYLLTVPAEDNFPLIAKFFAKLMGAKSSTSRLRERAVRQLEDRPWFKKLVKVSRWTFYYQIYVLGTSDKVAMITREHVRSKLTLLKSLDDATLKHVVNNG